MEKFEEAITNYIEKDEKFALFVDGEWGAGKTHFFEHDYYLNKIEKDNDETQETRDKKNHKKEYISVYGKHSLKEIQEIIVTKILSYVDDDIIKGSLKQGVNNIFKMLDIKFLNTENMTASIDDYLESKARENIKGKLNGNGESFVLIIDDIERLSDGISFKEFLGFIRNVLLDSFNCKVILVGNKKEIKNGNEQEMKKYWEKVISRNLKFPSNLKIGKNILKDNLEKQYFDEKEIKDLIELIQVLPLSKFKSNVLNLRTLNLVITDFKHIYDQLEDCSKKQVNIRMSLFTSLFILHNINRNNDTKNEEKFKELSVPYGTPYINYKKDEKKPSKQDEIYKKYFEENRIARHYAYFSSEIKRYILEGYIDVEKYQQQLNDNFSESNAEKDTMNILNEFYLYDEEKITKEEEKAVNIINEREYSFGYRLNIYMRLNILKVNNVLFLKDCDLKKIEERLLNSYELQKSNDFQGEMILTLNNYDLSWSDELNELKIDLKNKLKAKQSESLINSGIYKQYIEAVLNLDRQKMDKLEKDYIEILYLDIYEKLNEYIDYVRRELFESNAKIIDLNKILNSRDVKKINEDSISKFRQNIEQLKTKTKDRIAKHNFDILIKTLDNNI